MSPQGDHGGQDPPPVSLCQQLPASLGCSRKEDPGAGGLPWGAGGGSPPDAWELTSSLAALSQRANAPALITLRPPALFEEQNLTDAGPGGKRQLWVIKQNQGNAST